MERAGMLDNPLDPSTKESAGKIMDELPEHLQRYNAFIEYKIADEFLDRIPNKEPINVPAQYECE